MQPDAFADMVVHTVKAALGPVLERLAAAEARIAMLPAAEKTWSDIRDRVVAVETKASAPAAVDVIPDLAPVLERVAAAEARLSVLGDLRDRVVAVETKAAMPLTPDATVGELRDRVLTIETKAAAPTAVDHALTEMKSRLTVLESRDVAPPPVVGEDIRDRLVTLETRSAGPSVTDMAVVDLRERLASLERRVVDDQATKEIAAIRERIAVVEVKAQVPGPPGKDGLDGKAGMDGLGWDDLSVVQDDERVFTMRCARGHQVKELGTFTFPLDIYRGVYVDGKSYERGDGVTWAGSEWHCNEPTTFKPGDGSKAWTLKVKRGRDGKDGRDGHDSLPVVSVGRST